MASTDARPIPLKNTAFRLYVEFRKIDGTLCTAWAGADSEVSKDGAAFADCTNELTEIGSSGIGYVDLTSTEMNADSVAYKGTITTSGALPVFVPLYPAEVGDVLVDGHLRSATFATDQDIYDAKIWLFDDNGGTTDRYVVSWLKNGVRVTAGISSPTIQVIKASDGSDLIASTAMTQIAATGRYKYDATSGERIVSGAGYLAVVGATIDGSARSVDLPVGRDST